jgi:hypothetical protein
MTKLLLETQGRLQRNIGGMVKLFVMILCKGVKSAIRSQVPNVVMQDYGKGSETKW